MFHSWLNSCLQAIGVSVKSKSICNTPPLTTAHKYWKVAQTPFIWAFTGMTHGIKPPMNALISKIKASQDLWVVVSPPPPPPKK